MTALCADGNHEKCPGRVAKGYPETGIKESPCDCDCHSWDEHMEKADMEYHRG